MPPWPLILLVAIVPVIFAVDRIGLWMESRGWIYWRKVKPKGTFAAGLRGMEEFLHPEIRHVIEDRDQRKLADTDEEGAPPNAPR